MNISSQQTRALGEKGRIQRVLLTGGRAPAALDLARQFAAAGHHVYMAESCPAHLCCHSHAIVRSYTVPKPNEDPDAYITALKEIILIEKIDWLIPTCEEIFYVARGLDQLSKDCSIFVDSLDKLRRLHSKWEFICRAKEFGFAVPTTHFLSTIEDAKTICSVPGKWVFKPVFSRSGAKVFMIDTCKLPHEAKPSKDDKIAKLITEKMTFLSEQNPWVAQQFIEGEAYCSYSIAKQGQLTAHAVYPVRFTAGLGACISFEAADHPAINRWVKRFIALEKFTGQIAFDFIVSAAGQVYPIECNPRATSGIHLFRAEDRIDQAIFDGSQPVKNIITPYPTRKPMISLAMLSYGLFSVRSWSTFKQWFRFIAGGKDVVLRMKDLQPFFQQFYLLWWSLKVSRSQRITILEAATHDIEWNGRELK